MAYQDIVPGSVALSTVQGIKIEKAVALFSSANVAANLTGFYSTLLTVIFPGGGGSAALPLSSTSDAVGTSTGLNIILPAADTSGLAPGTYNVNIVGKPLTGDDEQLLCTGTLNIARAS
jgi:hypothetical protein